MQPFGNSQLTREYKYTTEVHFDFGIGFDISDYLNNAPMIKKLNEEKIQALTTCLLFERKSVEVEGKLKDTEGKLKEASTRLEDLNKELGDLKAKADNQDRETNLRVASQSILVVLGATLFGFGVNLATASPGNWTGWVMSIFGIALQLAAITVVILPYLEGKKH